MVKQNIIITGYEDSDDGSRTRFKTNKGWMSSFKNEGETLIQDLKSHPEQLISVDASPSKSMKKDGTPYINIRKFYGVADENTEEDEVVEKKEPATESAAKAICNEQEENKPRMKPYEKDPVGLCVDLICAGHKVDSAIEAVKKIVKEFS